MFKAITAVIFGSFLLVGCATTQMESMELSNIAKEITPPSEGKAGIYIFRVSGPGEALKKDIWVDGESIGESAPDVFFYEEVAGGEQHKVSTEMDSESSPNYLLINAENGKNYFIQQYVSSGVLANDRANLRLVDNEKGGNYVSKIKSAKQLMAQK